MLYAIVALLVLILDQAVKYWATVGIELNTGSTAIIPGVISLVNTHNTGAAFGFLQTHNARWFFVAIAAVFAVVVILALWKNIIRAPLGRWSAVLVMSGAIGNCIDRVINGYVVDMFRLDFMNFAIFNVADIFITVCGILFCVYIIFDEDFKGKSPASAGAPDQSPRAGDKKPLPKGKKSPAPGKNHNPGVQARKPEPQAGRDNSAAGPAAPSPENPFSEWETLQGQNPGGSPVKSTVIASSVTSQEAVSKEPPKARPAQPKTEFSLEEILAEYTSK